MSIPLTPAATTGPRNTSLLSAFALMLVFAFGVGSTVVPVAAAGQQLLPSDLGTPLLADTDTSLDPVLPVAVFVVLAFAGLAGCPPARRHECITVIPSLAFLARAPPLGLPINR